MHSLKVSAAIGLLLAALAPAGPAAAQSEITLLAAQIRAQTPSCAQYPDAPVVGRVVGLAGARPTRTLSFVGCFQSLEACESWRRPVSGVVTRRIIYDRCEAR